MIFSLAVLGMETPISYVIGKYLSPTFPCLVLPSESLSQNRAHTYTSQTSSWEIGTRLTSYNCTGCFPYKGSSSQTETARGQDLACVFLLSSARGREQTRTSPFAVCDRCLT